MHDTFEFNLLDFETTEQKMDAKNGWDLAWRFLRVWLFFIELQPARAHTLIWNSCSNLFKHI